jgi:hypothetical protein
MMQVIVNKHFEMINGRLNRARPVKLSPAESNLVKPLRDKTRAGRRRGYFKMVQAGKSTGSGDISTSWMNHPNEPNQTVISKKYVNCFHS